MLWRSYLIRVSIRWAQVVARVTTVMSFGELDISIFSHADFNASFRGDYTAVLAAFAGVVEEDVVIEEVAAGSVLVTAAVYFSETALGEPETFAEQMGGYVLPVWLLC